VDTTAVVCHLLVFMLHVFCLNSPNSCAEEMRNRALSALTGTEHPPLDQRKSSLAFKDISANTIAEQLTYLEYRMLRRIPVSTCIHNL